MNFSLIITLTCVLVVLILGYSVLAQIREKARLARKQESSRYLAIIDSTEELIANLHHIPFSASLLRCLHRRVLDALSSLFVISADAQKEYIKTKILYTETQIKNWSSGNKQANTAFKSPTTDKQALIMLRLVKQLRETVRNEHSKGQLSTDEYMTENTRLENIQIRINIDNVMKRIQDAMQSGQSGTAMQLIKKGLDALSQRSDEYSMEATKKLSAMMEKIKQSRSKITEKEKEKRIADEAQRKELDTLFERKKIKW